MTEILYHRKGDSYRAYITEHKPRDIFFFQHIIDRLLGFALRNYYNLNMQAQMHAEDILSKGIYNSQDIAYPLANTNTQETVSWI
ncbi:hypothetical protein ACJX0J_026493, partial [Zea mays]